ncbi:MAG: hypothetical protein NT038_07355 [Euryarchaeota archaeon]|nr:hypothetical protein [Euryarchaeota archaeon]
MVEVKVVISDELHRKLRGFSDVELSLLANRVVNEKFERLARLKRIVSKSKLSEKKAAEISGKINKSLAKRYEEL